MTVIKSTVRLTDLIRGIEALADGRLQQALAVAMDVSAQAMDRYMVVDRLSRRGPQTLGVVTGTARRSIAHRSGADANKAFAEFGSPLRYVRAHDQGFQGIAKVRAHQRRGRKRGSSSQVSAHTRRMNIRARRFFLKTLQVGKPGTEARVIQALKILARTGRIPNFGELAGVSGA